MSPHKSSPGHCLCQVADTSSFQHIPNVPQGRNEPMFPGCEIYARIAACAKYGSRFGTEAQKEVEKDVLRRCRSDLLRYLTSMSDASAPSRRYADLIERTLKLPPIPRHCSFSPTSTSVVIPSPILTYNLLASQLTWYVVVPQG